MLRSKKIIWYSLLLIALLSGTVRSASAESAFSPVSQSGWKAVGYGTGYMRFDHLSVADGLSEDTVLTILQDQQGFLWFGTREGLNLYDGYDFMVYQADPNDPDSLSDAYITAAVEDPGGDLWLGTYYGGLNRFDRQSENFEHFLPDPDNPHALPTERINSLLMTSKGRLWVGTRAGLSVMDPIEKDFQTYTNEPSNSASISNDEILSMYEDPDGYLWIGTQDGLNMFDPSQGKFTHFLKGMTSGVSQVNAITGDGDHGLWVGTSNGLFHFDRRSLTYQVYSQEVNNAQSLSSNVITSLYLDHSGALWVGFADSGLDLLTGFNPETFQVIAYTHQDYDVNSLSHDGIGAIFEDQGGIMWFGTFGGGINKANPITRAFGYYQHKPGDQNSPSSDNITALAFDKSRRCLWIGTADSGLDRMDLTTGKFVHYVNKPDNPTTLHSNHVLLLHSGPNGKLYVSTTGGPLQVYNPLVGGFSDAIPQEEGSQNEAGTTAMTHDRNGMIWLSQTSGELIMFDPHDETTVRYQLEISQAPYLRDDVILDIYADDEGIIWLGTESQGLVRFDPAENSFKVYDENGTTTGPSHNSITNIYPDLDGILWLGTAGGGLNRFDPVADRFTYYTIENGLPSNRIFGIARDSFDYLWLSTGNGLVRLSPISGLVRTYDVHDGLQGSAFNLNAHAVGNDGVLFFGGINGFNAFYPSEITGNDHIPSVVITSVSLFNQVLATNISDCSATLSLTHDQNFLSFDFAALDYTAPDRNQYAYKLEGLNDDYVNAGTRRYADYPDLNWGKYTFKLLASNNDAVWNTQGACLNIVIRAPFWATWWFIGLVGLFLAASVVIGYRWRSRQIEQQRQQLAVQVFERTQEIERRRQMATGLSEVIRLLNTNQPLEMSLDFIVKQAVGLTSASKAAIFERQEDLVVVKACYPEGATHALDLTNPESSSAKSLLESTFLNRLLIYSRINPHTMLSDTHWELVSGDYRTVICTPLLVDKVVYGGLVLYYGEDRTFTPDEINLAHTFANQASLAISNEHLKGRAQEAAVVAERNRLARDLHDVVTQTLFSTSLIAEVIPKIWEKDPEQAQKQLDELRQLTRGALGEMRTLLMELRPSAFEDANPEELFKHLTDAFSGRTGVPVEFEVDNISSCELPVEVKNVFYRIAQEGLNNVFKHADASQVWFRFGCYDQDVILSISDDGQGFERDDVPAGHLGLNIMAERAESIGADLTLVSQPDEGTTLRLVWHFEENQLK